jgi:dipeptidyl aminopeptidase/acylaminoacyl peptidase
LASGPGGPDLGLGIWAISILGRNWRKLRDDAWVATPSPDGSQVAFISPDYKELWVMKANGEGSRRVVALGTGATFLQLAWAPDGRRLGYLKNYSLKFERAIETCDLNGGQVRVVWSDRLLKSFCWTTRGRMIATLNDPEQDSSTSAARSDLWELEVRDTGAVGSPNRLTRFAGFTPFSLSVTLDGKKLALIRSYSQSDVYLGELNAGKSMGRPRRLTLDDRIDWPSGWTRDGKAILFFSDRQGSMDLFKQPVDARTAELLLSDGQEKRQPQMTPDGSAIVYLAWPRMPAGAFPSKGMLKRIPAAGGPPQDLVEVNGYPGSAQVPRELGTRVLTASGYPDFRCPYRSGSACILAESDSSNRVIFYSFDPSRGNKTEAARADIHGASFWDLSPDGTQIVLAEAERKDRIRILPMGTGGSREVAVNGLRTIASIGWSNDGSSFFITGTAPEGGSIVRHITPDGRGQILYQADAWLERPIVAPDGSRLIFGQATSSNNVWTVENFEPK